MTNCGQVFKIHSDFYYVNVDNKIVECKLREVLKKQQKKVFVGDFVKISDFKIEKILPRKNYIPRPSVSNVDQIVIVSSVKEPELNFVQLNRYICFSKFYDIPIKLCFNKNDLSFNDALTKKVLSIYEPLDFDIIFTSALEKSNIEGFIELLNNKTSALCGTSGVGKSSLINAINPNLQIKTKAVSSKTERGTHTTRHSEIISLTKNIRIIDTPGFSNLKFDFILPKDVDTLFEEFSPYKDFCKFADCLHIQKNGCEVLKNIDKIDETRYESYLIFLDEAKEYKKKIKYYGTKEESFVKVLNDKTITKISARKRQFSRKKLKQSTNKDSDDEELY